MAEQSQRHRMSKRDLIAIDVDINMNTRNVQLLVRHVSHARKRITLQRCARHKATQGKCMLWNRVTVTITCSLAQSMWNKKYASKRLTVQRWRMAMSGLKN